LLLLSNLDEIAKEDLAAAQISIDKNLNIIIGDATLNRAVDIIPRFEPKSKSNCELNSLVTTRTMLTLPSFLKNSTQIAWQVAQQQVKLITLYG